MNIPSSRLLLAVALGAAASGANAQRMASLRGRVLVDSIESPVLGAEVTVQDLRGAVMSDSLGRFLFANIPAGKQLVMIRRLGFSPLKAILVFVPGDTLEGDFLLENTAQRLKGVTVKARALPIPRYVSDFEDRRKSGFGGNFIGPEQIENMQNRRTDDILRLVPGPSITRSNVSSQAWVSSGRGEINKGHTLTRNEINLGADPNKCYATVYLDGVAVYSGLPGEGLFDVNTVFATTIYGMEWYSGASTVPGQFPPKNDTCGVLLIWTKP